MSPLRLEKRVPEENQHRFYRKRCLSLAITHICGMQLWACAERAWP